MRPDAVRERFDPAHDEPAVEWRSHRAARGLHGAHALKEVVVGSPDEGATHDVAVTAEVLRR